LSKGGRLSIVMQATDGGRHVSGSDNIFRIGNLRQA
jgi:hypothetical protein